MREFNFDDAINGRYRIFTKCGKKVLGLRYYPYESFRVNYPYPDINKGHWQGYVIGLIGTREWDKNGKSQDNEQGDLMIHEPSLEVKIDANT